MLKNFKKVYFINHFIQQSGTVRLIVRNYASQSKNTEHKSNIYSVLNPYIDFEERISSQKLNQSIAQRNIKIDMDNILLLWKQYKQIEETKYKLEKKRMEIVEKIKTFTEAINHEEEIEKCKIKGKIIRQDLKNLTHVFSDLEQILLPKIIRLPNDLENNLYQKDCEMFFIPNCKSDHHLDIAEKLDVVEYISPFAYFLKNDAVDFELLVTSSFFNFFAKHGFVPLSNPDFSRNLITEGCSVCYKSVFPIQQNTNDIEDKLYLNGTASLLPFCSFHTKQVSSVIPVRYVSLGRKYEQKCVDNGLYSVCQNSSVQIFIGSSTATNSEEFNKTIALLMQMYKHFGLHFRVVKIDPSQLELSEALKVSFQVHSPFTNEFVEVGNLSFYGEYISKRLRLYYKENGNTNFMSIISGTILKIPPLLGAYLENKKECKIPEKILSYTYDEI